MQRRLSDKDCRSYAAVSAAELILIGEGRIATRSIRATALPVAHLFPIDRFQGAFEQVERRLRLRRKPNEPLCRGFLRFDQVPSQISESAGCSPNNAYTHKCRRLFDYQFGILYRRQQEPNRQKIEFYGHTLVRTFCREP